MSALKNKKIRKPACFKVVAKCKFVRFLMELGNNLIFLPRVIKILTSLLREQPYQALYFFKSQSYI